jgi:hypothetical protein
LRMAELLERLATETLRGADGDDVAEVAKLGRELRRGDGRIILKDWAAVSGHTGLGGGRRLCLLTFGKLAFSSSETRVVGRRTSQESPGVNQSAWMCPSGSAYTTRSGAGAGSTNVSGVRPGAIGPRCCTTEQGWRPPTK